MYLFLIRPLCSYNFSVDHDLSSASTAFIYGKGVESSGLFETVSIVIGDYRYGHEVITRD